MILKTDFEPQRRRALERRAFVAHKLLLLQPQQVAVVRLGSLCSSSHTAKNFAFIFDMQALVRLFLPCGSPCVRSTSDCAMLLRSRRIKDGGIIREMSLPMRVPLVASNELAIVTKSIAFVSPPRTTDNLVEDEQNTYSRRIYTRYVLIFRGRAARRRGSERRA